MRIDPNTGLPELPEGYFWRVGHPKEYVYGFTFEDTSKLAVRLMWEQPDREVEDKRNKIVQKLVPRPKRYEPQDPLTVDAQECKGTSDRAILDAANVIMKRWKAKAKMHSKLGDYPPKKLGA